MYKLPFKFRSDIEYRPNSRPEHSYDIPPDTSRLNPTPPDVRPDSSNSALTEHLVLKRSIKQWQSPRHPAYSSLSAMLRSFKDWPHGETQTPAYLSEAGFF